MGVPTNTCICEGEEGAAEWLDLPYQVHQGLVTSRSLFDVTAVAPVEVDV